MYRDLGKSKLYGKYLDPEQPNYDQLVQGIVATLATDAMAPGAGLEGSSSSDGSNFPFGGLLNIFYQKPKYLLLFFDIQTINIFTELFCKAWYVQ